MNSMTNTGILTICKASAGSGKTFTLAVEYIKHLVMDPTVYRRILAVTFTNKATAEMKQRIISQLYGISRQLDDSQDYLNCIVNNETVKQWYQETYCENAQKEKMPLEQVVRNNCEKALTMIIHDYQRFRIETIDSFFQTIVRELAHDLNLTANLKVELDKDGALSEGVERVIDAILDDKVIRQGVFNYVNSKMQDNKNWAVNNELKEFGKNIFNEDFLKYGKKLREKLKNTDFLNNYRSNLKQLMSNFLSSLKSFGDDFFNICEKHGLEKNNFRQGAKGVYGFFMNLHGLDCQKPKLPNVNTYVQNCIDNSEEWSRETDVQQVVEQEKMIPLLNDTIEAVKKTKIFINTVTSIEENINNLALINTISQKVSDVTEDRGEFLLANTNFFLNEMIAESDVPFIYERTGTRFEHIMIDEFQDTSVLQWENFKPLIKNCLDSKNECLVVGDVKQSIYRWRNSDWSILNNMNEDQTLKAFVKETSLDTNYRSEARVIDFNNKFFMQASELLSQSYENDVNGNAQDILNAYDGCEQNIPTHKNSKQGFVRVELKEMKKSNNQEQTEEELDYNDWHCKRIEDNVKRLMEAGVPQNNICILVNQNKYIPVICDYFDRLKEPINGEKVKIVSMQAYKVGNSIAVRMIILALKMLQNPQEKLYKVMLAYQYQTNVMHNQMAENDLNLFFLADSDELNGFLPDELTADMEQMALIPLYELCERLYLILHLDKLEGQDSFLFAFYDHLNKFLESNNTDTENFLKMWDEKIADKTINDGCANGIRIMTIHKSKGLEFHSVIVPFATWTVKTDNKGYLTNLMWCNPKEEPFNELPLCPVKIKKDTGETIFAEDYKKELLKQYVDNLNVLYVAMTRASQNLIVISHKVEKGAEDVKTMCDVLMKAMPDELKNNVVKSDDDIKVFEYPESEVVGFQKKEKTTDNNVMKELPSTQSLAFRSTESKGEFRQSNQSKRFVLEEDADKNRTKYLDEGLLFHAILSDIETLEDVDRAVERLDIEGCFDGAHHREDVKRLVKNAFENPKSKLWFDPKWTVINENAIIFKDNEGKINTCRPDRVITDGNETLVIDYKTGRYHQKHEQQVKNYMDLLRQMGHKNVKGFLWYIRQQSIIDIY